MPYLTLATHSDRVFLLYCCAKFSLAALPVASREGYWRSANISQQPCEHCGIKFTQNARNSSVIAANEYEP